MATIKTNNIFMFFLSILCFLVLIMSTSCGNKKYDVTIKIARCERLGAYNYGPVMETWIFTPDIEVLHSELKYDGKEYAYFVHSYNLPKHPRWHNEWIAPNSSGRNVFNGHYGKVNQRYDEEAPKFIKDIGEYYFYASATAKSDIWNYRSIRLYIDVV